MVTVHHLNLSRSHRVLWLLEELGLPYEVKNYQRNDKTMLAPPELAAVHPLGRSPVITDGDLTLAESGAILEYLAERDPSSALTRAPGTPDRTRYLYWMHYAEGSLMPPLFSVLLFERIRRAPVPFFLKPVTGKIADQGQKGYSQPVLKRHLDFIESELAQRPWFAGNEFSAADIQMSYPLEAADKRVGNQGRPSIQAFLQRIKQRPAFQRAEERGGEFGIPVFKS